MKKIFFCAVAILLIITACQKTAKAPSSPSVADTPAPQNTASVTPTLTAVYSATASPTITATFTKTATGTITSTPTITLTHTITQTDTATPTCTVTPLLMTFQNGVLPDASYTGCDGTYIRSNAPDNAYGACAAITVMKEMSWIYNGFVRFSVSSVPAGSVIARAYLTMGSNVYYTMGTPPYTINIYRCASNWSSGDLCNTAVDASVNTHATWTKSGVADWISAGGDKAGIAGAFIYSGAGTYTAEVSAAAVQS